MRTMSVQAEIGTDGKLRVETPVDLPPGKVEVVIVVQEPVSPSRPPYDSLAGILAGKLPADIDIDAALDEMNQAWKRKLDLFVD